MQILASYSYLHYEGLMFDLLSAPVLPVLFPSLIVHMLRVCVKAGLWSFGVY